MKKIIKKTRNFLDFIFCYRYLATNRLKKIFFKDFFSLTPYPNIEIIPGNKSVCVLSPHIDDDAIGCGGFVGLLQKNNCPVTVYYIDSSPDIRRKEAEELQKLVQYKEVIYGNSNKIDFNFMLNQPFEIILLPDYFDNHHFHHTVTKSFIKFYQKNFSSLKNTFLYFYEIWSPLIPNTIVDITSVIEMKKKFIAVFTSQLADKDYVRISTGLNQYRSLHYPKKNCLYAEVFFKVSPDQMLSFFKRIS